MLQNAPLVLFVALVEFWTLSIGYNSRMTTLITRVAPKKIYGNYILSTSKFDQVIAPNSPVIYV